MGLEGSRIAPHNGIAEGLRDESQDTKFVSVPDRLSLQLASESSNSIQQLVLSSTPDECGSC